MEVHALILIKKHVLQDYIKRIVEPSKHLEGDRNYQPKDLLNELLYRFNKGMVKGNLYDNTRFAVNLIDKNRVEYHLGVSLTVDNNHDLYDNYIEHEFIENIKSFVSKHRYICSLEYLYCGEGIENIVGSIGHFYVGNTSQNQQITEEILLHTMMHLLQGYVVKVFSFDLYKEINRRLESTNIITDVGSGTNIELSEMGVEGFITYIYGHYKDKGEINLYDIIRKIDKYSILFTFNKDNNKETFISSDINGI